MKKTLLIIGILFQICFKTFGQPGNDNCPGTAITSNGACLSGTVLGATGSYGANQCTGCTCTSPDDKDVYYNFVAQAASHTVTISNYASNFDAVIELRTACGFNSALGCYDPTGVPTQVQYTWNNLTIGTKYYIRVYEYNYTGTPPSSPTFTICVTHTTSCIAPTTQANNITFSGVAQTSMTANWANGNGSRRLVYINTTNSFTAPSIGTSPTASTSYSGGQQCIYNGSGSSVTVTNLTCATTYYVRVYEANCTGSSSVYYTATATNNPNSQAVSACSCNAPTTQSNSITFSSIGQTNMTANWANGNGSRRVVYINTANSFTVPSNGTSPTAATSYSGGQQCIYNASGSSVTVTSLTCATTYYVRVYEANCTGSSSVYYTSSATNNPNNQATSACSNGLLHGVDVSASNETVSWSQVYTSIPSHSFAYVKATEGTSCSSCTTFFKSAITRSNPYAVVFGAYHYARPDNGHTALEEANYFLSIAGPYIGNGYLPPSLDMDFAPIQGYLSGHTIAQLAQWVNDWCTQVYNMTNPHRWPVLYVDRCNGAGPLYPYYQNSTINANIKLWIADYGHAAGSPGNSSLCSSTPWVGWPWVFHQYFAPQVGGYNPNDGADPGMDQDVFNGDITAFNNLIGGTTPPPPSLDCSNAISLTCGIPYNGTTVGGKSNVSTNGCNSWTDTGPEIVHTITTTSTGDITATLSNLGSIDLDVYILKSCNNSDCFGTVTSNADTYTNAPAGTYYILVDGYNGASGSYTLTVTANCGVSSTLTVTPTNLTLGSTSNSNDQINVTSNVSWTASEDASWLTVSPATSSNNGTITVTATSTNTSTSSRSGPVTITGSGITRTVSVTQSGTPTTPTLTVTPSSLTLGSTSNSSDQINVTSNVSWTVSDDASWLTVSPASSSNNGTITVTATSANTSTSSRSGTVTITGSGITRTVSVTQNGTNLSSYCSAGSSLADEYISNVTLGSINQTPDIGTAGYQDFTSQSTTLQIGENATVTITLGVGYTSDQILIWVDWNKDGDFTDTGENVYATLGSLPYMTSTANFTVPTGATIGSTRMRIRLHDTANGPNATPCGISDYGEVEDYTINVIAACTAPTSPTNATASLMTITSGQSTTLQEVGGVLNSASDWIWYTGDCGDTPIGNGATLPVSPTVTTTYYVQASACGTTTTCRSVTIIVGTGVGLDEPESSGIAVYPNPANTKLTIEVKKGNSYILKKVDMINEMGQVMLTVHENLSSGKKIIDVSKFADGIYFLKITMQNGVQKTIKVVIKR